MSAGQTFLNDMTLAVYCQLIRAMLDANWRPQRFRTKGSIVDRHRGVELFAESHAGTHPHSTGLAFPTEFLSRRLLSASVTSDFTTSRDWEFGPNDSGPVVEKLYRLLASQFPYCKLPTLDVVSRMVDVSPRTLKRQLKRAGTSFTALLDRLRFDIACEMLAIPQITIREISFELGYSGTNNFVRSFRRMTGLTPREYRCRLSHDAAS